MSAVLLAVATLFAAVAALAGFDVIDAAHVLGWFAAGVAFLCAALLVERVPRP